MTIKNVILVSQKDEYDIIGTNRLRNLSDQLKFSLGKNKCSEGRENAVCEKEGNDSGNWRKFKDIQVKILRK